MLRGEPKGLWHKIFYIYAASSTFVGDFQHIFMSHHALHSINHIGAKLCKFPSYGVSKYDTVRYAPSIHTTKNTNKLQVVGVFILLIP
ncbi:hypothetical protein CIP100275_00268 [Corynebacterium diphtheriae]|nr:hypothetical protein CIP100275_00268 [Corynebacterium diphtheriae]